MTGVDSPFTFQKTLFNTDHVNKWHAGRKANSVAARPETGFSSSIEINVNCEVAKTHLVAIVQNVWLTRF